MRCSVSGLSSAMAIQVEIFRKASITLCVYFPRFSCLGRRVLSGEAMRKKSARWFLGDKAKVFKRNSYSRDNWVYP